MQPFSPVVAVTPAMGLGMSALASSAGGSR